MVREVWRKSSACRARKAMGLDSDDKQSLRAQLYFPFMQLTCGRSSLAVQSGCRRTVALSIEMRTQRLASAPGLTGMAAQ